MIGEAVFVGVVLVFVEAFVVVVVALVVAFEWFVFLEWYLFDLFFFLPRFLNLKFYHFFTTRETTNGELGVNESLCNRASPLHNELYSNE